MFALDRRALGILAALALALGGGALGVGCGDDPEGDNGAGGSGGSGGAGGTGGSGGIEPCGMDICAEGETCKDYSIEKRCECDPDNDGCETGFYCDSGTLRCEELPPPAQELFACRGEGARSGDLVCTALGSGSFWMRPCQTAADCVIPDTFCPTEFGFSPQVCFPNSCGATDGNTSAGLPENGKEWGSCDPSGRNRASPKGACIPGATATASGSCEPIGTSTESCRHRPMGGFQEEHACAAGWVCVDNNPFEYLRGGVCDSDEQCPASFECVEGACQVKACTDDSDCAGSDYCSSDGLCARPGTCVEVCNAGAKGSSAGPYAGCSNEELGCTRAAGVTTPLDNDVVLGVCDEPECHNDNDCGPEFVCIEGSCRVPPTPCTEETVEEDCEAGEICEDGFCARAECQEETAEEDCGDGEICVAGRCVEAECSEETAEEDCEEGEVCIDGKCQTEPSEEPECTEETADEDCEEGEVCVDGACVADEEEGDDA